MEASPSQPRGCRRGWADPGADRANGRGDVPRRDQGAAAHREVPAATGAAAVHPEERRNAAAVGDSGGARPGGASGGKACAGTDLRGRLQGLLAWVSATKGSHGSAGDDPPTRWT